MVSSLRLEEVGSSNAKVSSEAVHNKPTADINSLQFLGDKSSIKAPEQHCPKSKKEELLEVNATKNSAVHYHSNSRSEVAYD